MASVMMKKREKNYTSHISTAMEWLCAAQDAAKDNGGVAGWYSFLKGWSRAYPETTGYIIPTFLDYFEKTRDEAYRARALKMADWLLTVQMDNGAFQGHTVDVDPVPRVFNTGMVLLGLVRAYVETKEQRYLVQAQRGGDFILKAQDDDGAWRRYAYKDVPHSYYSMVSWALLQLAGVTGDRKYTECARKNLDWVLTCKEKDHWFRNAAFGEADTPYLHTIAYLLEGLLESGAVLGENRYIEAAAAAAGKLMTIFEVKKRMPGEFCGRWRHKVSYNCLTGSAQISIVWQRIYQMSSDARFLNASLKINDYLRTRQFDLPVRSLKGGIAGSFPLWGGYHPFWLPSWAAKFFVDSLLLEEAIMESLEKDEDRDTYRT
jgi:hypothetical protein